MCVIVYKPASQPMPSWETLEACWDANPHGAGFMRPDCGRVIIRKGFMEWDSFAAALEGELGRFDAAASPIALHFRIATHGAVAPGCCHPFPVCASAAEMRETEQAAEIGFMHNGILDGLTTTREVSDTMAFDKAVLAPLATLAGNLLDSDEARRVIGSSTQGSRFLLMDGCGRVLTFGRWTAIGGVLYSNDRFRARTAPRMGQDTAGLGAQATLLDALAAFGSPADLGLYPQCEPCGMLPECAGGFPCCGSEAEAGRTASLF